MKNDPVKLVILDRDGVINHDSPAYVKSRQEFHVIPGSLEAIVRLNQAGIKVAVATNQSGIARGYYTAAILNNIHQKMQNQLKKIGGRLEAILFCPHHPDENCVCRKPKPDMLIKIGQLLNINLKQAVMIGDKKSDIEAGLNAGVNRCIFIQPDLKKEKLFNLSNLSGHSFDQAIAVFSDLSQAVDDLL